MTLHEQIVNLATKYQVQSILDRVESIATNPSAKIGLIGPFSSGKTSLLNAMIGSKLPVALDPTTKSVCLVEFRKGLEKAQYFLDDGNDRKPVSFMEFDDLIAGLNAEKEIVGVAQFPEMGDFHEDVVFVDTPGVDSLGREEADVTYNYLAFLDAAIVCLPITDGTIQQSVVDFLADPRLSMIAKHLIFVLTKCDLKKSSESLEVVKAEAIRQLETLTEKGVLALGRDVADRVFTFSTKQDSAELVAFLRAHLLQEVPQLARTRQALQFKDTAIELADILDEQGRQLHYDSSKLDAEKQRLKTDLAMLEADTQKRKSTFVALEDKLRDELFNIMMGYESAITSAQDEEARKTSIQMMVASLQQTATDFAQRHVKDFHPGDGLCKNLDVRLNDMLATIERVRDVSVQVITAVALAAVAPGAGVAGNVAEGGGAMAIQKVAQPMAKQAKKADGFLKRSFGSLGKLIKDLNPLETVGDLVAMKAKNNKFEAMARQTASSTAGHLLASLDEPYQDAVIRPLMERIQEAKRSIDLLRSQDAQALADFREKRKQIAEESNALRTAANA